jgi:Uma2 family endonuclease
MAAPAHVRPTFAPSPCLAQSFYRLTVRQFERMMADGTIADDERVELIEGLLVARPRRTRAEIVAGNKGLRILWRMIPPGWHVAKAVPILTSDWSRPEPDLAVIRGVVEDDDDRTITADDTALVVEIAGTNLPSDRTDMARVYAAAGIPVYWIVNLAEGQIEVFSEPGGDGYESRHVLGRGQDVPVVVAGGVETAWIAVSDLLA